jgi:hypothetical protein
MSLFRILLYSLRYVVAITGQFRLIFALARPKSLGSNIAGGWIETTAPTCKQGRRSTPNLDRNISDKSSREKNSEAALTSQERPTEGTASQEMRIFYSGEVICKL